MQKNRSFSPLAESMKRVLVTDGRTLSALAIARSLGSKGIRVDCGDTSARTITSFSKFVSESIVYPSPAESQSDFVACLLERAKKRQYDLIVPTSDETALALAKHSAALSSYTTVYLPEYDSMRTLLDKGKTMRLAERNGVSIPETYYPDELGIETVSERVSYPALIKPRRSSGARGIRIVDSAGELERAYTEVQQEYDAPIVQEYIDHDGGHFSIGALFDRNSELVALHVYEETKQYPVSGGPAVEAESVPVESWVYDLLQIFDAVDWVGPAHMDVLYDISDETPKLLEVNPRFWMSVALSIRSGVDVPALLYQLSVSSDRSEPVVEFETDIGYKWILPSGLLWATQQESLLRGLHQIIASPGHPVCYGVLSRRDPGAILGVTMQSLSFLFQQEKRRQIFDRGW